MSLWFRYYTETLDDPKVQRLPGDTFKGWVNLLALAARNGGVLPPHADIAFALRMPDAKTTALLDTLIAAELFDHDETGIRPHNWNGRQYKTDVSTERVKRFRKRHETVSETPDETSPDTETESEQIKPNPNGLGKKPAKRKTAIAPDWKPDERDLAYAAKAGWDAERIEREAEKFRNSNTANARRYADWNAAWRTWVGNAPQFAARTSPARRGRQTAGEADDAILASVAHELELERTAAGWVRRPSGGLGGHRAHAGAVNGGSPRGADEAAVCEPADATEGIAGDVAGTAGEVPAGRSETGLGSRPEHTQMGDPAEDRADGGSSGNGPVVSAPAHGQSHAGESHHAAGLGRAGSDADLLDIPDFLRRTA